MHQYLPEVSKCKMSQTFTPPPLFLLFIISSLSISHPPTYILLPNFKQIFRCSNLCPLSNLNQSSPQPLFSTRQYPTAIYKMAKHTRFQTFGTWAKFPGNLVLCLLYLIKLANLSWKYMMCICMDVESRDHNFSWSKYGGSKLVQAKKLKLLKMFHKTLAGLNGPWSEIRD